MSEVTFGKMDRSDPSTPTMDFFVDGGREGCIEAQMEDVNRTSQGNIWRVTGYAVTNYADPAYSEKDHSDPYFEVHGDGDARTALAAAKEYVRGWFRNKASGNPSMTPEEKRVKQEIDALERVKRGLFYEARKRMYPDAYLTDKEMADIHAVIASDEKRNDRAIADLKAQKKALKPPITDLDIQEKARKKKIREAQAEAHELSSKLYDRSVEERLFKEIGLISGGPNSQAKINRYEAAWKAYQDPLKARREELDQIVRDLEAQDPKKIASAAKREAGKLTTKARHDAGRVMPTDRCQICEGEFAFDGAGMVLHGFKRPGHGYLLGECMGVHHAPFPATDALERYLLSIKKFESDTQEQLDVLPNTDWISKRVQKDAWSKPVMVRIYKRDATPLDWSNLYRIAEANLSTDLRHVRADIRRVVERIKLGKSMR